MPVDTSVLITEQQFHLAGQWTWEGFLLYCECQWRYHLIVYFKTSSSRSQQREANGVAKSLDIPALNVLIMQKPTEGNGPVHTGWVGFLPETHACVIKTVCMREAQGPHQRPSEELVSLTFERRLILSSLSSRTRKLGGTYQQHIFMCWGYKEESKIHIQPKLTISKVPRMFQIYYAASEYNSYFSVCNHFWSAWLSARTESLAAVSIFTAYPPAQAAFLGMIVP